MLRSIVSCAAVGLVTACASVPRQTRVMSVANVEMSTDELRQRVYELGSREEGLVLDAIARIYARSTDLRIRRAAIDWGLAAVPAVQDATLRPEPLVAVIDLWALALQTENWAREGPGRARLGEGSSIVEQASREMASECEQLGKLVLGGSAAKQDEARHRMERWAAENPITSAMFDRPSASVAWSGAFVEDQRSALASFVINTDQRLDLLGQRVAMLNRNVMTRMRWTLELLLQDSLGKENVAALLDEGIHGLATQRRALLADMERERLALFAQITSEHEAITAEANALVAQTDSRVNALVAQTDARARALIDRLLFGAALVGASLILLAACAIWVLRHGARRPPGRKADAAMLGSRPVT